MRLALAAVAGLMLLAAPAQAAWPGANGRILFTSENRLYTVDPGGGAWTRLFPDELRSAQAAWSPDGQRVAFRAGPDGDSEIWVVNADGSGLRQITTTPNEGFTSYSSQPGWSPDGRSIVFRSDRQGDNADIWVMGADGANPRLLLSTPGDERYPAFSPDGTRLVYRTGDPPEIWVARADGTGSVQLTSNALFDSAPAWSPDSARLAFERGEAGADVRGSAPYASMEIWTMAADGSDQRPVTSNGVHDEGPAWAPDGSGQLVFTRDDGTNSDLYVGERRLTDAASLEESPDWQALPRSPESGAPPPPGSPGSPEPAPQPSPAVGPSFTPVPTIASRRVRLTRTGTVAVRVRCGEPCSAGRLTLRTTTGARRAIASFSTARDSTRTVRLRLGPRTRRFVARRGRATLVAVATARGQATARVRLTVLPPRR